MDYKTATTLYVRYHELEERLGKLAPLVEVDLKASNTVTVTVRLDGTSKKSELMDLNVHWTLLELKRALKDFAEMPTTAYELFHKKELYHYGMECMIYPTRTVLRYKVEDGDEIIIMKKIVRGKKPLVI